jgi:acyl transferase domain-containing protein/NAD(P)-dependent dehydrogenase (short-subunit alcohol dehydrogenase family)/SAM-dependent methyltransferase
MNRNKIADFQVSAVDDKILWDIWLSMYHLATVSVADEINLFQALETTPLSFAELAKQLGISTRAAETLSGILIGLNLLKKDAGKLSLTPQAEMYLVPSSPFYWGELLHQVRGRTEHKALLIAVRQDRNPFSVYGRLSDDWESSSLSLETARKFTSLMHSMIFAPAHNAVKSGLFEPVTRLLDVGGGSGCFGIVFVKAYPGRQAGIFDLPPVCEITKEYLRQFAVEGQVSVHPGNFFKDAWPKGYDGLCFSNIFHDWSPENCKKLARSAYETLEPGGSIFLHEMLLDEDKSGPLTTAFFDLYMFMDFSAQQFTQAELMDMLNEAGFQEPTITQTFGYYSVVSARKPQHVQVGSCESSIPQKMKMDHGEVKQPKHQKIAFVFSGMGAQWKQMGKQLFEQEEVFRQTIEQCEHQFRLIAPWSITEALFKEISRLEQSAVANPCMLAVQLALTALLKTWGIAPDGVIGHSTGEFAAAYTAGVLSLEQTFQALWRHCQFMERIPYTGLMAHISVSAEQAVEILQPYHNQVIIAAINSPKATVISGEAQAVTNIVEALTEKEIFCKILKIDIPFHSAAINPNDMEMDHIHPSTATIPLYSSVRGGLSQSGDYGVEYWKQHIRKPVMFAAGIEAMIQDGYKVFLEISPHPVLSTSINECLQEHDATDCVVIPTLKREENEKDELLVSLAALDMAGCPVCSDCLNAADRERFRAYVKRIEEENAEHETQLLKELKKASPSAQKRLLTDFIKQSVFQISKQEISPEDPQQGFLDMGLTSLMAVRLKNILESELRLSLSVTLAFDYPNMTALSEYLIVRLAEQTDVRSDRFSDSPEVGRSDKSHTTSETISVSKAQRDDPGPVAVVGMGCRFPGGANTPELFWDLLANGRDAMTEVPPERWKIDAYYDPDPEAPGKMITRLGGFLADVDISKFDAHFFRISPKEAQSLDPQQRLLLEVSWEAFENAGIPVDHLKNKEVGVYLGISTDDYKYAHLWSHDLKDIDSYAASGSMYSSAGGRLSYIFGFQGPNVSVDTACSSSLVALHLACQALQRNECEIAIVAGVNCLLTPNLYIAFSKLGALSPSGRSKTFDASADGYARGEGCGVVVLKRLSDAQRDGDRILALIRGSALNQDGASSSFTAPNGIAQQQVMRKALRNANISPGEVSYVEAHGTGTPLGDPIEMNALGQIYGKGHDRRTPLIVGSVKANIGHLEAAAGIAGIIKIMLALQHETIPPQVHFQTPNPHISWEMLPVKVPTQLTPWTKGDTPRIAGISSFGFSGTNAHVILEEAPEDWRLKIEDCQLKIENCQSSIFNLQSSIFNLQSIERPEHILTLSAKTGEALQALALRYADHLVHNPTLSIADVCYTANACRSQFHHRVGIMCQSVSQLKEKLMAFAEGREMNGVISGQVQHSEHIPIAFLFTGQGAQYINMGRRLYETHPTFRKTLDHCDEILRAYLEIPLLEVLYSKIEDCQLKIENCQSSIFNLQSSIINETAYTQPALFALEYALFKVLESWGITPTVVMGHSVGEYTAACVAGIFSLEDGLKLIATRARLMQALPKDGTMVAVFADEAQVSQVIQPYGYAVSIAAVNGPEHTVISGQKGAVRDIVAALETQGIRTKVLTVSHAFHSPLMEPMLPDFERIAREVRYSRPKIDVVSNLTGTLATDDITTAAYWRRHIRQPVRFADSMETLFEQGYEVFLEIGPRPTLLGMARQIVDWRLAIDDCRSSTGNDQSTINNQQSTILWLPTLRKGTDEWQQILQSLGTLYVQGVNINWAGFDQDYPRHRVDLPTYPFQRQRYWHDRATTTSGRSRQDFERLHPLIDRKIQAPLLKATLFETWFSASSLPFLQDHLVYDQVVVSGASYISMLLGAVALTLGTEQCVLKDVIFPQALVVPNEDGCVVQLVITPNGQEQASFQLISLKTDERDGNDSWSVHAAGSIVRSHRFSDSDEAGISDKSLTTNTPEALQSLWNRCQQEQTAAKFYEAQRQRHIYLGPGYQWLETIRSENGEAVCRISAPPSLKDLEKYQLHPGLIDAGFGLLLSTAEIGAEETFMPFRIEEVRFYRRPVHFRLWGHCKIRPASGEDQFVGDIGLFDDTGQPIIEFIGFESRKARREIVAVAAGKYLQQWLYEVEWQPKTLSGMRPEYLPDPTAIRTALLPDVLQSAAQIAFYEELSPKLEDLSVQYLLSALAQLGWSWTLHQRFSIAAMARQLRVINQHHKLLRRVLTILTEENIIRSQDNQWEVVLEPQIDDPQILMDALKAQYPAVKTELELIERCGTKLADVLKGECDPLQLLFPEGDLASATQFYQDTPLAQTMNTIVQKVMISALERLPQERMVRILEIGAGTGGTTSYILPHLPHDQTEYVFTDVSGLFITYAQERFKNYPFVQYKLLNIERSPAQQGFEAHQYDIVVAANVLHATRNLRETLAHIHSILAPGGILILMEGTAQQCWLDVTFGLIEGWWRFADHDLRPEYPLLPTDGWRALLQERGFTQIAFLPPEQGNEVFTLYQTVIVAQAAAQAEIPMSAPENDEQWLILADDRGIARQLSEYLNTTGADTTLVFAGNEYERLSEHAFKIDPNCAEDFERILETVPSHKRRLRGVVHCWSLEAASAESLTVEKLNQAQIYGCGSTLHLIQALIRADFSASPSMWIVTQGAVPVPFRREDFAIRSRPLPGMAQSPIWGMAKVIALEHPEFKCVRVDLEPEIEAEKAAQVLFGEIRSDRAEDQVAFRESVRYVPRLVRVKNDLFKEQGEKLSALFQSDSTYLITGGLGGLGLLVAKWMVEEQGVKYLVLVGRRGARPEVGTQLNALEQAGAKVVVAQADVAEPQQIARILTEIEQSLPPLRGIIHAAGVLDDGMLMNQPWQKFAKVLAPKVQGAWNLHALTSHLPLDFFVVFSSAASLLGSHGQANHSAANAFLDALAYHRQAQGLTGLSINWGAWSQIGAAAAIKADERMPLIGMGSVAPWEGLQILRQLFPQTGAQVGVIPINWPQFLKQRGGSPFFSRIQEAETPAAEPKENLVDQLKSIPVKERRPYLMAYIQSLVAYVLGLNSPQTVETRQGFFDLGMDSLTSVEMRNRLQTDVGCSLPSTLLFTYPTVASLVEYLTEEVLCEVMKASPEADFQEIGDLVAQQTQDEHEFAYLDALSQDELEALIKKELESTRLEK